MGSEDDSRDLGAGEWRRHWRLGEWGVKTTVETWPRGNRDEGGDDCGDLGAGSGDDSGDLGAGE